MTEPKTETRQKKVETPDETLEKVCASLRRVGIPAYATKTRNRKKEVKK